MKELANNILAQIEVDISEIDLYGYDIIETSLSMVHKLQTVLDELRVKIQTYIFPTKEDEILFFKTKKPELLVNPEKPDVPLNKNDAFQKVQKRRVQEKR